MRFAKALLAVGMAAAMAPGAGWAASPSGGFHLITRSAHVSYYGRGRGRADVKSSEAFLARLAEVFGPAPKGWRIEYYLHSSSEGVRARSGAAAVGLTDLAANRIDSVRPFHPHELVHAVAGRLGRCPAFFAEGLAVALASEARWGGRGVDAVAREALVSGVSLEALLTRFFEQDPDRAYPLAGSFVAFLLDRHGIDAFAAFLEGCGRSPRAYETAFRRAYGRTVAGALRAWRAALLRGEAARWTWTDPASWPESLRRGAPGGGAASAPAVRSAAVAVLGGDELLSAERR